MSSPVTFSAVVIVKSAARSKNPERYFSPEVENEW
jgi:hypothetical protein